MMTLGFFRSHCLAKFGATEDTPFGEDTLCFRVGGKIFALLNMDSFQYVNLKCEPEQASDLRERYAGITPGYHMNKKHWNSVSVKGDIPDQLILTLVDHSYELVFGSLSQKIKFQLLP
jgi:predicted DNA-binding protein (MmcQ/YjbR family)